MKTFPSNFTTEKNKKTGASPVWILKCPFATGTIYLSDRAFTVASWNGGITTKSWIKSWSAIDENIGGQIATPQVADFSITVINDPDDASNIGALLWNATNKPETTDCELYLWFTDLNPATDPPQKIFVGNIIDFEQEDELCYRLTLVDQSVRHDKYVGTVIDTTTYPNADPDEIGKTANILYGSLTKIRCHAIKAGAADPLTADITATSPGNSGTLVLSDAAEFPASGAFTIQVDNEKIRIASRSGNTLTLASSGARGYSGTKATDHQKGADAFEVLTEYVYLVASHPVKTLGDVYVDDVRQTSGVTKYTGQTGNEHASYPGKAVVAFTVKPVVIKQVNLTVNEGNHAHITSPAIMAVRVEDWGNDSGSWAWEAVGPYRFDGDFTSGDHTVGTTSTWFCRRTPVQQTGIPIQFRMCISSGASNYTGTGTAYLYKNASQYAVTSMSIGGSTKHTNYSAWISLSNWNEFNTPNTYIQINGNNNLFVYEIWFEVQYNPTAPSSPATGVDLSGKSSADIVVGQSVNVKVSGYKDDASGTITGTANALIEYPDHIIKHLLYTYSAWPLANFYTDAHTNFVNKPYKFAGVINEKKKLKEWLAKLAFQCRCYFRFSNGQAQLLWRPDTLSSQKTITANMIRMQDDAKTTRKLYRSPLDEIINKIEVHYDRDWTQSGDDAYKGLSKTSDATSITAYGEKEKPELFYFDFVTTQSMANDVRDFYIARYKNRKKLVEMELFLDNAEVEFGDDVTITPQSSLLGEVQKVNIYPGSALEMRNDKLTIVVKEY